MKELSLNKLLAPLYRRIALLVARSIIEHTKDDLGLQVAQVSLLAGEVKDNLEILAHYGFSSRPQIGSEAVVFFLGGNRDHGLIIATEDRRYRLKNLDQGEVALYTDEGDVIHLKRGRVIDIKTMTLNIEAQSQITINTPMMTLSGALKADEVEDSQGKLSRLRTNHNTHIHGVSGAATTTPTGGFDA